MVDSRESYTGGPKPLDERVFETIRETRQVLSLAEHQYGSFSRNSHEDDLEAASSDLSPDQVTMLLEGMGITVDYEGVATRFFEQLDAWVAEERAKKLKAVISETYTSTQEGRLMGLLGGKQVVVRDRGTRASPAIVSVRDGGACLEARGYARRIDAITGIMGLSSAEGEFELNPSEWTVNVLDLANNTQLVDLHVHDSTE